jgi:hypothetical protein
MPTLYLRNRINRTGLQGGFGQALGQALPRGLMLGRLGHCVPGSPPVTWQGAVGHRSFPATPSPARERFCRGVAG